MSLVYVPVNVFNIFLAPTPYLNMRWKLDSMHGSQKDLTIRAKPNKNATDKTPKLNLWAILFLKIKSEKYFILYIRTFVLYFRTAFRDLFQPL